jgi:hypothetical protein
VIIDSYWFILILWVSLSLGFVGLDRRMLILFAQSSVQNHLHCVWLTTAYTRPSSWRVAEVRKGPSAVYPGWFLCLCSLWCTLQDIAKHDVNLRTFGDPEFRTPSSGGSKGDLLSKLANEPSQRLPEQEVAVIATWHTPGFYRCISRQVGSSSVVQLVHPGWTVDRQSENDCVHGIMLKTCIHAYNI